MAKQDVLATKDQQPHRDEPKHQQRQEPKEPPQYTATRTVRAFKVKSIDRNSNATITLIPEDDAFARVQLGGKQAEAVPGWNSSTPNSDPGYAVLDETGQRYWMGTQEFESLYGQSKEQRTK